MITSLLDRIDKCVKAFLMAGHLQFFSNWCARVSKAPGKMGWGSWMGLVPRKLCKIKFDRVHF